jgi:putative MFS transporter
VAVYWGEDAWRVIFFVTGLPALIGVVLRFYIPESPMYLNRNGKSEEARKVLQRVAKVNGNTVDIPALQPEKQERKSLFALFSQICAVAASRCSWLGR